MRRVTSGIMCLLSFVFLTACSAHHRGGDHGHGKGRDAMDRATQEVSARVDETVKDSHTAESVKGVLDAIIAEVKRLREGTREFHHARYDLTAK